MAGLCEGGIELPGALKAIVTARGTEAPSFSTLLGIESSGKRLFTESRQNMRRYFDPCHRIKNEGCFAMRRGGALEERLGEGLDVLAVGQLFVKALLRDDKNREEEEEEEEEMCLYALDVY
ncbi:hypothetical protein ANN_22768 [Periplaneta americana]|uniref:Uncharacterized protein n=1 Tax=Periplaneta americana TaxID=6978 RepID=A0ABQ8SL77_PERAM|nr:hypothetical protein ANN_22768 [Periplaneta americana]